jgi:Tfp pilus assembly protein PilO
MRYFSNVKPQLVDTETLKQYKVKKVSKFQSLEKTNLILFTKNNIFTIILIILFILFLTYRYYYTIDQKEKSTVLNQQLIQIYQQQLGDQEYKYQKNKEQIKSADKHIKKQKYDDQNFGYMDHHNFF